MRLLAVIDQIEVRPPEWSVVGIPPGYEVLFSFTRIVNDADDPTSVSWRQEFLAKTPILGQPALPNREVLGNLAMSPTGELIPDLGRFLKLGQVASITLLSPGESFDVYIAIEVHEKPSGEGAENIFGANSNRVLLRLQGPTSSENIWVAARQVVAIRCAAAVGQPISIWAEAVGGPETSPRIQGLVLRSLVIIPRDDFDLRIRALEHADQASG